MPARQGKSKEKIKSHINTPEQYKYYIEENVSGANSMFKISKNQYVKFLKDFFNEIVKELMYSAYEFILPYKTGKLSIVRYQQKVNFRKDGTLSNNLPVNWDATLKLWETDEESKLKKKLVKIINKDKFVYRFLYTKGGRKVKNLYYYHFKATRTNKLKLKTAIKKDSVEVLSLF